MEKIRTFFKDLKAKPTIVTIVGAIAGIWLLSLILGILTEPDSPIVSQAASTPMASTNVHAAVPASLPKSSDSPAETQTPVIAAPQQGAGEAAPPPAIPSPVPGHSAGTQAQGSDTQLQPALPIPTGVTFVDAVVVPLEFELKHRFWGWRPNDIINFTDNVNYFQLGVLEVSRRTVVQLAERISRTGSTDAFNPHLENAMNWLMITAQRYWFPSPESKYLESLEQLGKYRELLLSKRATFYIRADNLIPLLAAYEDLLGSCDENLVKQKEPDGSDVSFFRADDYFYYAKGVASAMAGILEAIEHDFAPTLERRNGMDLLHHAVASCHRASAISPIIILDAGLDSTFANHRAHMAAPISHAQFYLRQLIKTLST
jgi:hypothetical protein